MKYVMSSLLLVSSLRITRCLVGFNNKYHHDSQIVSRTTTTAIRYFSTTKLIEEEETIYKELKNLSKFIRECDEKYYQETYNNSQTNVTTSSMLSDDEYDVLTKREAEICIEYPHLLNRLENESGLGKIVTRFGGRVGPVLSSKSSMIMNVSLQGPSRPSTAQQPLRRKHLSPMLSLDNAMSIEDVSAWFKRLYRLFLRKEEDAEMENTKSLCILAEPKLDGLSLSLRYEQIDGAGNIYQLVWGATRGDGVEGEDVTHAVRLMHESIPDSITLLQDETTDLTKSLPLTFEVKGEVVLPTDSLEVLNKKSMELSNNSSTTNRFPIFANARNAASGILRRSKNIDEESIQSLKFYAYDTVFSVGSGTEFFLGETNGELRCNLKEMGFDVPEPSSLVQVDLCSFEESNSALMDITSFHSTLLDERDNLDFEIDGVVYKIDSLGLRSVAGSSSRAPRWAIAHKFQSKVGLTQLLDIELQVGRTGSITPVAILKPVDIAGVSVSRATLHNFHQASSILGYSNQDKGVSMFEQEVKRGASVMIARAGDVIPKVVRKMDIDLPDADALKNNDSSSTEMISLAPPTKCPACGSHTFFDISDELTKRLKRSNSTEIDNANGQVLRCGGSPYHCRPRKVAAFVHAFSKGALDVRGLSERRITQLIEADILKEPADIFSIMISEESALNRLAEIDRWGPVSALNMMDAVRNAAKGVPLDRFILSLGIRHIGAINSQLLANKYKRVEDFLYALRRINENVNDDSETSKLMTFDLDGDADEKVKGIGPVIISSLEAFAKDTVAIEAAERLANYLHVLEASPQIENEIDRDSPISGLKIIFTGRLEVEGYGKMTRTEAEDIAKNLGAIPVKTITKSTDIVIQGEGGGGKVSKAENYGIKIMSAGKWFQMLSEHK